MKYSWLLIISLLLVPLTTAAVIYPTNQSTIIYYHLNQNSSLGENGTYIYDYSGNNRSGNGSNLLFNSTGGPFGAGDYYFNGLNTTIQSTLNISVNNISGYMVGFWINPVSTLVRSRPTNTNNLWNMYYGDAGGSGSSLQWFVGNGTSLSAGSNAANFLTFGSYQWVVLNYDTTTSTGSLYKNGILTNTQSFSSSNINSTAAIVCLMSTGTTCGNNFANGSMTEYIVYNRSMTAQQIWDIYVNYSGGCITPNGSTFTLDTQLCNSRNNYYGVTTIATLAANNINLDCNSANLTGNYTQSGIVSTGYSNLTYNSCILNRFTNALFLQNGNNISSINNSFYDINVSGIRYINVSNSYIANNYIVNATFTSTTSQASIYAFTESNNLIIENNSILYGYNAIKTFSSNNVTIRNNRVYNDSNYGIVTLGSNNSNVYNNSVNYSGWNGIATQAFYINVYNNIIIGHWHHGIDIFEGGTSATSGNNNIYNNTIMNGRDSHGVYVVNSSNNKIYSNNINNMSGATDPHGAYGIETDGTNSDGNNSFYNNTITNVNKSCIYSANSVGNYIYNNTLINCTQSTYRTANDKNLYLEDQFIQFSNLNYTSAYINTTELYSIHLSDYTLGILNFTISKINNSLVYESSGRVFCINIPTCSVVNVNTSYRNTTYILENYTIDQSSARIYDPIIISSTSGSTRNIQSTLIQNISNVSVSVYVGASNVVSPTITNSLSTTNITIYSIANGLFTFNTTITPGSNLVVLDASTLPQTPAQVRTGACASSAASFASLAPWMIVFVTVLCAIFVVMAVKGVFNFQLMIVGVISILLLSFLMMFGIIIFTSVASICT